MQPAVRDAIVRAATEEGIDPATALAYAQRESSFDPTARSSRSIYGLYQMTAPLRYRYGSGDSADPYTQTKAWAQLLKDNKAEMSHRLGRDVSDAEAYAGHHFGAGRAAKMFRMDPNAPTTGGLFNAQELAGNPHIGRAATVGNLLDTTVSDIDRRRANFGAEDKPLDFSSVADPADASPTTGTTGSPALPDFSQFAEAA